MNRTHTDARSKITWGEPSSEVKDFLIESNLTEQQADTLLTELLNERNQSVKRNGIRKMLKSSFVAIGCGLLIYLQLNTIDSLSAYGIRRFAAFSLTLTTLGFFWGLWKATDGIMEFKNPNKFKGDIGIHTN